MNKNKKFAGFTLIELLVVIVIIGILATISIATFGNYIKSSKKAKELAEKRENCTKTIAACIGNGNNDCLSLDQCMNGTIAIDLGGGIVQNWSTKNVNTGTQIDLATAVSQGGLHSGQKVCYNDNPTNCDIYGGLYDATAADNLCGNGFHLPSNNEWMKLIQDYILTTYGKAGPFTSVNSIIENNQSSSATNELGLGALFGGYSDGSDFTGLTKLSVFHIGGYNGTVNMASPNYSSYISNLNSSVYMGTSSSNLGSRYLASVRCLKD